jgi:F0F1-type ATP synthase membrane subunit b/b'
MELETEELLQKWLKLQIWQYRLAIIFKLLMVLTIGVSIWFTYVYLLPPLQKQIENTQKILESISQVSETSKQQEDVFKGLLENLPVQLPQ